MEADIVRRAQAGDRSAFAELYDTYLPKIHDFALGMLRNRADAEDVTSDTFLKAVERLGSLKDPAAFRGWLYAIARNSALNVVEARKRAVPTAEQDESATLSEGSLLLDPEEQALAGEIRDLVWDAAATLNPRDAQVFELTVRHGLGSAEVADALGVRPAYAYILVNRLKDSVEEAIETVLLARTNRGTCAELSAILARYGEPTNPRTRKAVARHAKSCAICVETKRTRASVPALLAGAAFAAPSAAFAAELAAKIDEAWLEAMPSGGGTTGGTTGGSGRGRTVGILASVIVLATATIGVTAQRTIHRTELVDGGSTTDDDTASPSPSASPGDSASPGASPGAGAPGAPELDTPATDAPVPGPGDPTSPPEPQPEPSDDPEPTPRRTPRPTAEPTASPSPTPTQPPTRGGP